MNEPENIMNNCSICPRNCRINRFETTGYCKAPQTIKIARAALHMWEEPCISGSEGSGAVFFSGCNMQCVYCQNRNIADGSIGAQVSEERLAEIFINLQNKKANNINLVTPGHYVYQIRKALDLAFSKGLKLPIVYNTGSYEKVDTLDIMKGYVNIYLPDMKYADNDIALKYSNAPDYNSIAMKAIEEMLKQVGGAEFDDRGMMTKGVIVRHLLLPGNLNDSKKVISQLYENFGDEIYISIMSQYTPVNNTEFLQLSRKVKKKEYEELVDYAISLGVENGFIQEGSTADESFIPEFDLTGVYEERTDE